MGTKELGKTRQPKMPSDAKFLRQLDDIYEGLQHEEETRAKQRLEAEIRRDLPDIPEEFGKFEPP